MQHPAPTVKPARKLGNYGTSAFRAPSRDEVHQLAAAAAAASKTTTTVEETFTPKSSFDEAARADGIRGSTIAARMKSNKPRFQQSVAQRELEVRNQSSAAGDEKVEAIFRQQSPTPSRAARQAPDFARDKSPRIAFHAAAMPGGATASGGNSPSATARRHRSPTQSRRAESPVAPAAAAAAPISKPILTDDPLSHLTIAARAQKKAQRPDPVFANTAPRFKRLGTPATSSTAAAAAAPAADTDFYTPRGGIAETANAHALVKMSSTSAAERFPTKRPLSERAELFAPRGFADEVLRRNETARRRAAAIASRSSSKSSVAAGGGMSGVSGARLERSVTGEKIKPRFTDPERITAQVDMYAPPGLAEKIAVTALTRRSPAFSRPVSPHHNQQQQEQKPQQPAKHAAVATALESSWTPRGLAEEILRKNTAAVAFRSVTPRFAPRRLPPCAAPLADLLETRDKPDIEGARKVGTKSDAPSGSPAASGRGRAKTPTSVFQSKVPRWRDSKAPVDSDFYQPESFVDKILRK